MENLKEKKKYLPVLTGIIALAGVAFAIYFYLEAAELKKNPDVLLKEEAKNIMADLSKIILLPNEEPAIASVADPEKLKDQPFFAQAIEGDKVIFFKVAGKAILWRPSEKKIIEVSPLNLGAMTP